jgi:hypothetical protein
MTDDPVIERYRHEEVAKLGSGLQIVVGIMLAGAFAFGWRFLVVDTLGIARFPPRRRDCPVKTFDVAKSLV